ncbi:chemotaxis protein CheW [Tumidithrix elongata RA019]|uniref:Chemotaxis protein CheW n=1 Tax=Tumidithrix elongata BACA0141 TaxID=2716417 RepID=A0AAW9Q2Q0_9CYAN|nr:chemotaxis protein CheW [Tumidithrix elongata RA019]
MDSKPYLIFNQGNSQYGIDAQLVKEIFPLAELETVPEAPTDILGMLNLRGQVLPVMHLGLRLGLSAVSCQLSDQIVVLDWRGLQIGMVVDLVQELETIEGSAIQPQLDYGRTNNINPAFIAGIAKRESELIVLLDPETLIRQPDRVAAMIWESEVQPSQTQESQIQENQTQESLQENQTQEDVLQSEFINSLGDSDRSIWEEMVNQDRKEDIPAQEKSVEDPSSLLLTFGSFYDRYCPYITDREREIFWQRAENLRLPLENLNDATGLYPLAVVNLGGEYFGIDLKSVQEFTSIRNLTQIPCCPNHIVGNMNLRGEIVTLVDIRGLLKLPNMPVKIGSQTVVIQVDDVIAGLPVDEVADVMYVEPSEIKPVPMATQGSNQSFLKGILPVFDRVLGVLDLPKMMTQGGLVVDMEV